MTLLICTNEKRSIFNALISDNIFKRNHLFFNEIIIIKMELLTNEDAVFLYGNNDEIISNIRMILIDALPQTYMYVDNHCQQINWTRIRPDKTLGLNWLQND